ncbi:hypothetical protein SBA7_570012 [Candidatus Sulfotelmatobacter sp. SbA7]|nr:hypothetical protein SBA7_570012 [Candidatus Sulfotelmatobacter sp. SbA7]
MAVLGVLGSFKLLPHTGAGQE